MNNQKLFKINQLIQIYQNIFDIQIYQIYQKIK